MMKENKTHCSYAIFKGSLLYNLTGQLSALQEYKKNVNI